MPLISTQFLTEDNYLYFDWTGTSVTMLMFLYYTTDQEIIKEKRDNFYRNPSRDLFTGDSLAFEQLRCDHVKEREILIDPITSLLSEDKI